MPIPVVAYAYLSSPQQHHTTPMITVQAIALLLQKCSITSLPSSLYISCPSIPTCAKLVKSRNILPEALMSLGTEISEEIRLGIIAKNIKMVTMAVGRKVTSVPLNYDRVLLMNAVIEIPPRQRILAPQVEIIEECLAYDGACGVVRMSDHKGLFSNAQIVLSSNTHPNDWLGKKMSDFWIEAELDKYLERLRQDEELRNYSYVSKMFSGENARLTVNARIVIWNGEPARLVKTISRELLS